MENLYPALATGLFAFLGIVAGQFFVNRATKRKDNLAFYMDAAVKIGNAYGEIRRLLLLEDSVSLNNARLNREVAEGVMVYEEKLDQDMVNFLGIITAVGLTLNDKEITDIVLNRIWIPREDNQSRGKLQEELHILLKRLGMLIHQVRM